MWRGGATGGPGCGVWRGQVTISRGQRGGDRPPPCTQPGSRSPHSCRASSAASTIWHQNNLGTVTTKERDKNKADKSPFIRRRKFIMLSQETGGESRPVLVTDGAAVGWGVSRGSLQWQSIPMAVCNSAAEMIICSITTTIITPGRKQDKDR